MAFVCDHRNTIGDTNPAPTLFTIIPHDDRDAEVEMEVEASGNNARFSKAVRALNDFAFEALNVKPA